VRRAISSVRIVGAIFQRRAIHPIGSRSWLLPGRFVSRVAEYAANEQTKNVMVQIVRCIKLPQLRGTLIGLLKNGGLAPPDSIIDLDILMGPVPVPLFQQAVMVEFCLIRVGIGELLSIVARKATCQRDRFFRTGWLELEYWQQT